MKLLGILIAGSVAVSSSPSFGESLTSADYKDVEEAAKSVCEEATRSGSVVPASNVLQWARAKGWNLDKSLLLGKFCSTWARGYLSGYDDAAAGRIMGAKK